MRRLVDFIQIFLLIVILSLTLKACMVLFDVHTGDGVNCGTLHSWQAYTQCVKLIFTGE